MKFSTDGLILTEQTIMENDRLVTVLTRSNGIIRCFVRGAKHHGNKNQSATQTLCYSRLTIYSGKNRYTIDDAEQMELFFGLREDLESLALAQYFCELAITFVPEGAGADEYLSLILNSLYMLCQKTKPFLMIKAVYELRLMTVAGFMPDLVCCKKCWCYEAQEMYFLFGEGKLLCGNCYQGEPDSIRLSAGALTAMRHSIYAEPKKLFSFNISESSLGQLADCAERYLLSRSERSSFNSLDFYKTIRI